MEVERLKEEHLSIERNWNKKYIHLENIYNKIKPW